MTASIETSEVLFESLCDQIADALLGQGYSVLEQPLPAALTQSLMAELSNTASDNLKPAGIGRQGDYRLNADVRSDKIQWLTRDNSIAAEFLSWMDKLRLGLNQRLFLGLFDYESHYAIYEPGAFYHKHLDAFKGKPGRKLSTVFYLNDNWNKSDGGELVLYQPDSEEVLECIMPQAGRLVIFLSDEFPHEVLPAIRARHSIAGWFRVKSI